MGKRNLHGLISTEGSFIKKPQRLEIYLLKKKEKNMETAFVNMANPFKDGFALLDTNILSSIVKSKKISNFGKILDYLENLNCEITILNSTEFEFVGYSNNYSDYIKFDEWINKFNILDIKNDDIKLASFLSSLYKYRSREISPKQISFCDCLNAAQIIKYQGRLPLVASDIYDYPLFLFDIVKTMIIDDNGKAVFVGVIACNENKWISLKEKFEKSGHPNMPNKN